MTDLGLVGWTPVTPGYASPLQVSDGYAYVGDLGGWVHVFDVSDPTAPVVVGNFRHPSGHNEVVDIDVHGDTMYVSYDAFGIVKVDISDPANPVYVSSQRHGSYATSFDTDDGVYGYVSYGYTPYGEVKVYDLDAFTSGPVGVFDSVDGTHATSIDVVGDYMFLGVAKNYIGVFFEIVDVSDPTTPTLESSLLVDGYDYGNWQGVIEVSGDYAYWARGAIPSLGVSGGLLTIDVSEVDAPLVADFDAIPNAGSFGLPGGGGGPGLDVVGDRLYMASCDGLYIYDLTDPSDPVVLIDPRVDTEFAYPDEFLPSRAGWVDVENGFAYVTSMYTPPGGEAGGLAVYDVMPDIECDLFRGKEFTMDAGDVVFSNTAAGMAITLVGQDGWTVTEAKLHIGDIDTSTGELSGFPVNRGNNPKVGKFDYRETSVADEIVFEFDLEDLAAADTNDDGIVVVAVHASVETLVPGDAYDVVTASAWGGCEDTPLDFGGTSPSMLIEVDLADLGLFV